MAISLPQALIWIVIASIIGGVGELLARQSTRGGIIDAILDRFPLMSSFLAAALLVACWSTFAYRRVQHSSARYAQRDGYQRRWGRRRSRSREP